MIYADENVWIPVVNGLRRRGWSVTSVLEEETLGWSDREHLAYATERGWTLLTFDDDFLSLVEGEHSDLDHGGVVYVSQHGKRVGDLVQRIDATLQRYVESDLTNEVVYA